jgi:hypothetical protein
LPFQNLKTIRVNQRYPWSKFLKRLKNKKGRNRLPDPDLIYAIFAPFAANPLSAPEAAL